MTKKIIFFEFESFFKNEFSGASSELSKEISKTWRENGKEIIKELSDNADYYDNPENFYFLKTKHPIITNDNGVNVDIIGFSFKKSRTYEELAERIQGERSSSLHKSNLFGLEYDDKFAKQIANVLVIYNQIPPLESSFFYSAIVFFVKEIEFFPTQEIITIKGEIIQTWSVSTPWNIPKEINAIRMHLGNRFSELQGEILKIGEITEATFTIYKVNNQRINFEWQEKKGYQILNLVGSDSFSTLDMEVKKTKPKNSVENGRESNLIEDETKKESYYEGLWERWIVEGQKKLNPWLWVLLIIVLVAIFSWELLFANKSPLITAEEKKNRRNHHR